MIGSVFSIPSLLDAVGEEAVTDMLKTFSCVSDGVQLNEDVEKFVRNSSIEFYKRKMSVTYLVNDEDDRLAGIFTLTHKAVDIPAEGMSNAQKKRIQRFAVRSGHRCFSSLCISHCSVRQELCCEQRNEHPGHRADGMHNECAS